MIADECISASASCLFSHRLLTSMQPKPFKPPLFNITTTTNRNQTASNTKTLLTDSTYICRYLFKDIATTVVKVWLRFKHNNNWLLC